MVKQDLVIEAARPTDAAAIAPLIYSSGHQAFDYVFGQRRGGNRAQAYLQHAFVRNSGQFSHRNHLTIRYQGRVVASMFNYDNRGLGRMHWATVMSVLSYFHWHILGVAKRSGIIDQVIKPAAEDMLVVAHLAVAPEAQGLGLGSRLISHAENIAREHGYAGLALDVAMDNPSAQRLYERLGFCVRAEHPSPIGEVPGHRYMEWRF
ncbi:MAG: GNAT family N-acetyltransferase [Cellvibrionaceae bacterium]|nr:GNAT family N-acetyltransferase [Cellvibrionaceae bacterium]